MGRIADIEAEMAVRLAAREALDSVGRLAEAAPEEAERIAAEADLGFYEALLEDADRSVARRNGVDQRSELVMRSRQLREQSARLDRRMAESERSFEEYERRMDASRSLTNLADSMDGAGGGWSRKRR